MAQDKNSRVACETFVKSNVLRGRDLQAKFDYEQVIRKAIRDIGYVNDDDVFHADKVFINNYLTAQSPDIAQGVDARETAGKATAEQGAGDQGLMFGYACDETSGYDADYVFPPIGASAHQPRKAGKAKWLRPDAKTQVSVQYADNRPVKVTVWWFPHSMRRCQQQGHS